MQKDEIEKLEEALELERTQKEATEQARTTVRDDLKIKLES